MKFSVILRLFCFIFLAVTITLSDGYKILGIFPLPAKSHFTCNNAIMKSLIEAGHEVTVITSFPDQAAAENYTSIIDVSKNEFIYVSQTSFNDFARMGAHEMLGFASNMEKPFCNKVMKLPEIQKIINSDERLYDAVFVEILFIHKCFFAMAAKKNIPIIGTVTVKSWPYADNENANPNNPAYVPYAMIGSFHWKSFHDRLCNTWNYMVSAWYWHFGIMSMLNEFHEEHVKQLGPSTQYNDVRPSLLFVNNHASFMSRPTTPNTIEIGGIHLKKAKPLPQDIERFIDDAEHGVILFSFGSVTRAALLSPDIQEAFRSAFAEIPQRVIWKFEEQMENLPHNVMLMEWLPQRDILEHSNVKAFISHCGQGGTYEAIHTATPIISCPLFGDQPGNAALLKDLEVAVHLDINAVTKENVLQALNLIMNDTRYYDNMQQLSKVFKDRPMTAQQSVVYWTEYVIRHNGAPHLTTAAVHLYWFQYLLLDVICVVVSFTSIFAFVIYKIVESLLFYFAEMRKRFGKNSKNKSI